MYYSKFLNDYGIQYPAERSKYEVYFATSGNYKFTIAADDFAYLWLDNGEVNGEADYIGNTPTAAPDYQPYDFYHYVPAGWHTVDVYARNFGGVRSVAASALAPGAATYMWTTRSAYDEKTISETTIGRGGHGQDHPGDGGGAGGGGGGHSGGTGGTAPAGDNGAMSGNYGSTFANTVVHMELSNNTLLADGGGGGFGQGGLGGNGAIGTGGAVVFNSTQTDIKYNSSGNLIDVKEVYVKAVNSSGFGWWNVCTEVYVRDSGSWKRVYGSNIPNVVGYTVAYSNISGAMTPYPPPPAPAPAGGGGCKIICQKLAEMGFFDSAMNAADQQFGVMLRDQDPDAFNGYLRWAQPVVDLLEGKGSARFRKIVLFWVRDEQRRQQIQSNIVAHYLDVIARPWAEEMAYRMKAEGYDKSNPAGRFIMNIGLPMCRSIGRFNKHTELPMWLKTALIWGITTVLLVAVSSISMIDKVFNKIRKIFDRS